MVFIPQWQIRVASLGLDIVKFQPTQQSKDSEVVGKLTSDLATKSQENDEFKKVGMSDCDWVVYKDKVQSKSRIDDFAPPNETCKCK